MTKIIGSIPKHSHFGNLVNEWFFSKTGSESPVDARLFIESTKRLDLNWIGLYAMAIVETGYFNSQIFKNTKNMFGIGAVDSDPLEGAAVFFSYQESALCGAQHLGVYAGLPALKNKPENYFVIPRTFKIMQWGYYGLVSQFSELGGKTPDGKVKWASNPEHGKQVESLYAQIVAYCEDVYQPEPETPVTPEPPKNELPKGLIVAVLKILVSLIGKFFPWLGWLSFILYALIEYFSK